MKKLFAMALAMIMAIGMIAPASAANDGSITVNGVTDGKTYDIYKIFDLTKNSDASAVAYTIDSDWEAFFSGDGAGYIVATNSGNLSKITVGGADMFINITDANVAEFAQDALDYATAKAADATKEAEADGSLTFSNLALGYYLVYPQGAADIADGYGSLCSLTSTTPDGTVNVKATYPTIEKVADDDSVEVGQVVNFDISGKVPDTTGYNTYTYEITDTMTDGLTFNNDVKVSVDGTELTSNFTVKYDDDPSDPAPANSFVLTIDVMNLQDDAGKSILVEYSATVNENAIASVEENKAALEYSNDPAGGTDKTPDEVVKVFSAKIDIDKYAGVENDTDVSDNTRLQGAEFVLKNAQDKFYKYDDSTDVVSWVDAQADATVATTDADGAASFVGLENGTYNLVEIKAPEGYNLLTSAVPVEINGTDSSADLTFESQIANFAGALLPSTGGMGTTIFTVVGSVLMLGAAVLLVTKKKMANEE